MRRANLIKPGKIIIEEVSKPVPSKGEVLVAVKACGICGSDIHAYDGQNPFVKYPYIFGHEIIGEVIELGSGVKDVHIGNRVAVVPFFPCYKCYNCKRSRFNLCDSINYIEGGMGEYISVPVGSIVLIPDDISLEEAALIEPLAVGVHALSRTSLEKGGNILVFGAGTIGLLVLEVAKAFGVQKTIIVDLVENRLDVAKNLGVTYAVNAGKDSFKNYIEKLSQEIRIDAIFECVGIEGTLQQAIEISRKGSEIVIIGTYKGKVNVEIGLLQFREVDIRASSSYVREDFLRAVKLLSEKRVDVIPLLSKKFKFDEIISAFDEVKNNRDKIIKAIISF